MRKAPAFLTPALTDRIRSNTRGWIVRIEKALSKGELDAFNVHKQMSAAVKSFLQAATGARSETAAFEALQGSGAGQAFGNAQGSGAGQAFGNAQSSGAMKGVGAMQPSARSKVAALAEPYYESEYVCRSDREAQRLIDRGKELIEKWV